jgi:predicted nucleotide-binding protein (sugar kinase/HSP70/actin superfamily)
MPKYKVTFPHMGAASLAIESFLTELGFDVIVPPPLSRTTLTLGGKHSPEFACLPLKANLGSFLEVIPMGVDVIFMAGGVGPCRFGLYGEVQKEILHNLGHDVQFIVIEPPEHHFTEVISTFTRFLGHRFWLKLPRALQISWRKITAMDWVDECVIINAPLVQMEYRHQLWRGKADFIKQIADAGSVRTIKTIMDQAYDWAQSFPKIRENPHINKVMIVGELLVVMEPCINFGVEEKLSCQGVGIERTITFSRWIRENIFYNLMGIDWQKTVREAASPYLRRFIGGHGLDSVGHAVRAAYNNVDGIIQLAPLGCMPEVVAMEILSVVGKKEQIPILTLLIDEHTADTGVETRVEAFIDIIRSRKKQSLWCD